MGDLPGGLVAVDIGGTTAKWGLLRAGDAAGVSLLTQPEATPIASTGTAETIIRTVSEVVASALCEVERQGLRPVGIGIGVSRRAILTHLGG
jgi:hypothetical protein